MLSNMFAAGASSSSEGGSDFKVVDFRGNASLDHAITVGFAPDLVWIKNRYGQAPFVMFDTERGPYNYIKSDLGAIQTYEGDTLTSFDANGFTVSTDWKVNGNNTDMIAWCWKMGPAFDIVKYTGTGSSGLTMSHSLGEIPDLIFVKCLTSNYAWAVYSSSMVINETLQLNLPNKEDTNSAYFTNTRPISTTFRVGSSDSTNRFNEDYVAYLFKDIAGQSASGVYTGNSNKTGPVVNVGFSPSFLVIKNIDGVGPWVELDTVRDTNPMEIYLWLDVDSPEDYNASEIVIDFTATGFEIKSTGYQINANGDDYLYWAIK